MKKKTFMLTVISVLIIILSGCVNTDKKNENKLSNNSNQESSEKQEDVESEAEQNLRNSSEILKTIDMKDADGIMSEKDAYTLLKNRGFGENEITTEYGIDGNHTGPIVISEESDDKHPMYTTLYSTDKAEWIIYIINDRILVQPTLINNESSIELQTVLSEQKTINVYDSQKNRFYETIPHESTVIVEVIEQIDANVLDNFEF